MVNRRKMIAFACYRREALLPPLFFWAILQLTRCHPRMQHSKFESLRIVVVPQQYIKKK